VRKLFLSGMDLDLIVRVHPRRSGADAAPAADCIIAITQEVEDKK
tara:strand:- start:259 stop:393 length:135 start_codon:yes stop_codon:yes gene_type:complete